MRFYRIKRKSDAHIKYTTHTMMLMMLYIGRDESITSWIIIIACNSTNFVAPACVRSRHEICLQIPYSELINFFDYMNWRSVCTVCAAQYMFVFLSVYGGRQTGMENSHCYGPGAGARRMLPSSPALWVLVWK